MDSSSEQRLEQLESLVTFLQQDLQDFNDVVLRQQQIIERLQLALKDMDDRVGQLREGPAMPRDLEEERPPHY